MFARQLFAPLVNLVFPPLDSAAGAVAGLRVVTDSKLKHQIADVIDDERVIWEAVIAEIDPDQMEVPGIFSEWSFRDLAAHLLAWRDAGTRLLEAEARGEPEPPHPWPTVLETDDDINAWLQQVYSTQPLDDLLRDYSDSFVRLKIVVNALPEAALTDPGWFHWMNGESVAESMLDRSWFDHLHVEHEPQIRDWLNGD